MILLFSSQSNPVTGAMKSSSKMPQFYTPGMLPPPPPPPVRPVAVLRTSDGQTTTATTTSTTICKSTFYLGFTHL